MIGSIFEKLLVCSHRRLTRPITPLSKPGQPAGETYVVCLDCGRQFAYDWDRMRIGKEIERSPESRCPTPRYAGRREDEDQVRAARFGNPIGGSVR
jgi:DNA-directed RNA polymerase subunit RPC12/RpoP